MSSLLAELKRRNVFKVGIAYLALGWVVIQVTSIAVPALNLPPVLNGIVFYLGFIGFPFALLLAWAFELTPEGVKRSSTIHHTESILENTGRKIDFIIIAILVFALFFVLIDTYFLPKKNIKSTTNLQLHSIAVLPLKNMSSHTDNTFFAGGIHEEVLTNLSKIQGFKVTSRTSALSFQKSGKTLPQIANELGVTYILEGSVRRVNNFVRVTVQLIDAKSDHHLWAQNYDRELTDVFAVQSVIAKEITKAIHLELQPESVGLLDDMPTTSVKAYDLYNKARSIDRSEPESVQSMAKQQTFLEQAVQIDPNFVEAWGLLNEVYDHIIRNMHIADWHAGDNWHSIKKELTIKAKHALNKAVTLAPNNLETLLAQASDFVAEELQSKQASADYRKKRKSYIDKAIALYPNDAISWYVLGWWFSLDGQNEQAKLAFNKSLALDPLHARIIRGSLYHFELVDDSQMVKMLFERLDKSLDKASLYDKTANLYQQFLNTADESLVEEFTTNKIEVFADDIFFGANFIYSILLSGEQKILNLPILEIEKNASPAGKLRYIQLNANQLSIYQNRGEHEKAISIAQRIVDVHFSDNNNFLQERIDSIQAVAFQLIGNTEQAKHLVNKLLNDRRANYNPYGMSGFRALAYIDLERAVELVLAEKDKYNWWTGTDNLAIYHHTNRKILEHPKMQEYYLKEGKWINYLAKRVPAYKQYSKDQ